METSHLREYVTVADCGSLTAAARELHLTQSTLSKHIALLEREFGTDLFVRDRNGVSLTEAGRVLYDQALQMEKLLGATLTLVRATGEGRRRRASGGGGVSAKGVSGTVVATGASSGAAGVRANMELRCKCRHVAARCGLDQRELGALILYLEERGFDTIRTELGLTRDEVADVLGGVYRKLGVSDKQEALDFIHSVSE